MNEPRFAVYVDGQGYAVRVSNRKNALQTVKFYQDWDIASLTDGDKAADLINRCRAMGFTPRLVNSPVS